mmetsp:Transcript_18638/g.46765  ORF Transcript_18638/g.46765 Transcript_18638/m.46765 type:complete len:209 (+) Transcript_18638:283-909(+)
MRSEPSLRDLTLSCVMRVPSPMISLAAEEYKNSIFGFSLARFCMILLALSSSLRWITYTLLPYFVRNVASSIAESPPPTTAMGRWRKIGAAPSQTAHADTPFCQYSSFPGMGSTFAVAPVATITVLARIGASAPSGKTSSGNLSKSTRSIVSVRILVPNRALCARNFAVISSPVTPSGNPGKFSTSVVVVSCPPAATPPARKPSYITG